MASAGAGLLTGMGLGVGYGIFSEYARLGTLWGKWKIINALSPNFMKDVFSMTMESIIASEHDSVTGMSSKGTIDVMWEFINKTIDMSLLINEGIATQMFIQMIQQSIAYAIHSSHAGAIGTIGNVYSGSSSLSVAFGDNVGEDSEVIDDKHLGFIGASIGSNLPTIGYQLARGGNARLREHVTRLQRDVENIIDEWNDLTLSYYRQHHTMARDEFSNAINMKKDAVTRAYSILESMGNTHLSRIAEQLDTLVAGKEWFDATLISEEELIMLATRINLERTASEANYDEHKDAIIDAITLAIVDWDAYITTAMSDLTGNETLYNTLLNQALQSIFYDVSLLVDVILERLNLILEHICAYRNISPSLRFIKGIFEPFSPYDIMRYSTVYSNYQVCVLDNKMLIVQPTSLYTVSMLGEKFIASIPSTVATISVLANQYNVAQPTSTYSITIT